MQPAREPAALPNTSRRRRMIEDHLVRYPRADAVQELATQVGWLLSQVGRRVAAT